MGYTVGNVYVIAAVAVVGGALFGFDISSMSAIISTDAYLCYFNQGPLYLESDGKCSGPTPDVQGEYAHVVHHEKKMLTPLEEESQPLCQVALGSVQSSLAFSLIDSAERSLFRLEQSFGKLYLPLLKNIN